MTGARGSLATRVHTQHVTIPAHLPAHPSHSNHCPEHRLLVTKMTLLSRDQCSHGGDEGREGSADGPASCSSVCVCKAAAQSLTNTQLSPVLVSWVRS